MLRMLALATLLVSITACASGDGSGGDEEMNASGSAAEVRLRDRLENDLVALVIDVELVDLGRFLRDDLGLDAMLAFEVLEDQARWFERIRYRSGEERLGEGLRNALRPHGLDWEIRAGLLYVVRLPEVNGPESEPLGA